MEELGWIDTYLTIGLPAPEILARLGRSKQSVYNVITFLKEGNTIQDFYRLYKENKPFNYRFNFAFKHLLLADYVRYPRRGEVELTENGRKVDLETFDPVRDVRVISERDMVKESKKRKTKKAVTEVKDEEEIVESDGVEEVWRDRLKSALRAMSLPKFEMFARGLINKMGIDLDKTLGMLNSVDAGLDGFGYIIADDFRTTRVALQAKR